MLDCDVVHFNKSICNHFVLFILYQADKSHSKLMYFISNCKFISTSRNIVCMPIENETRKKTRDVIKKKN